MNPVQNALLALKIAAIRQLDHPGVLAFFGLNPSHTRPATYARLRGELPPTARALWDARPGTIARGIWYAGLWEKVLAFGARGNGLLRGRAVRALFDAPDLATQAAIWARRFDDRIWRASLRLLGRPWVWTRVIGEPGGAFLPAPAAVEARLAGAFTRAAGSFLFRDSDFAALMLRGRHDPRALPLHLRPESFAQIRAALPRLRIAEGGLTNLPDLKLGPVDAFSLSDFGSYTDRRAYAACWSGVLSVAAPGARFAERLFMNPLPPPDPRIGVDAGLSQRLTASDRAIIYDIRAGCIG